MAAAEAGHPTSAIGGYTLADRLLVAGGGGGGALSGLDVDSPDGDIFPRGGNGGNADSPGGTGQSTGGGCGEQLSGGSGGGAGTASAGGAAGRPARSHRAATAAPKPSTAARLADAGRRRRGRQIFRRRRRGRRLLRRGRRRRLA